MVGDSKAANLIRRAEIEPDCLATVVNSNCSPNTPRA
jgi:hypothetical protein